MSTEPDTQSKATVESTQKVVFYDRDINILEQKKHSEVLQESTVKHDFTHWRKSMFYKQFFKDEREKNSQDYGQIKVQVNRPAGKKPMQESQGKAFDRKKSSTLKLTQLLRSQAWKEKELSKSPPAKYYQSQAAQELLTSNISKTPASCESTLKMIRDKLDQLNEAPLAK